MNEAPVPLHPEARICYNCRHMAWLVGLGQGIRCRNPEHPENRQSEPIGRWWLIPARSHSCDLFERKKCLESQPD